MEPFYDVIVVGAGAAGMVAAGRAGELGGKVLLLEKMERAGRKILISGKGRCNITNTAPLEAFLQHIHPDGGFATSAFAGFFASDIVRLLERHGCPTVVERGGRIFPASNKAADVVGALLRWVAASGVTIRYGHKVEHLVIRGGVVTGVKVRSRAGCDVVEARHVICCTGGMSYPATGSDGDGYRFAAAAGHAIEPPRQALVPMETAGDLARRLCGLGLKNVRAAVWVDGRKERDEFGEMTFTETGLAGPIILTLSRFMVDQLRLQRQVEVAVDLKPALSPTQLDNRLQRDLAQFSSSRMDQIARKWLPAPLVPVMLDLTGVRTSLSGRMLAPADRQRLLGAMKDLRFVITGCRPFKEAIVTAGGVVTAQVDPSTMESRIVRNLHFAGEVLDLDADTGGFNLQIAFSTGWHAADACMAGRGSPDAGGC